MKYSPIVPYFMITAMTCNMQFYTRKPERINAGTKIQSITRFLFIIN